ncbi:MAG: (2Fe-2S)-binding protein [Hyphomicrobiaceae bacterium]|nr:(2Fe-2S)-binding protein [Hyphomicrobiaceae bacterium]
MIVCSCTQITDTDIEAALVEILSVPNAPLPTPGLVYRHLQMKMECCGCAPLAVTTIYEKIDELAKKGLACPYACASARGRIEKSVENNPIQMQRLAVIRKLRGITQGHTIIEEAMALKPQRA